VTMAVEKYWKNVPIKQETIITPVIYVGQQM